MRIPDMMPVFTGQMTMAEAVSDFSYADLREAAESLYNEIDSIVADATDEAVVFVPKDPASKEPDEQGWTLGHVVVHVTAGLEELSSTSAMLARGITLGEERFRFEVPWETVHTAAQIHQRLKESRRMTMGFLDGWPDEPHLDVTHTMIPRFGPVNAIAIFSLGLFHTNSHLAQFREIMRQYREQ